MISSYEVGYSTDAYNDLREIYAYIANELLVPDTAATQLRRIQKKILSLDFLPSRYALVELEPWHSKKVHQLPVDNYIVYYVVKEEQKTVTVVRIFYSGQNVENIVNSKETLDN